MKKRTLYWLAINAALLSINLHAMDLRVDNVKLYQPETENFSQPSRLYIDEGKIIKVASMTVAAEAADEVINAHGQYAVPGLTDLHVHLGASGSNYGSEFQYLPVSSHFNTNLHLGVTNIVDLFSFDRTLDEAKALQENELTPNFFYAGALFTNPGGHGTQFGGGALEVVDDSSIDTLWKQHIARAPHLTKAVIETFGGTATTLTDKQLTEIGKRSRAANLPYFVHVTSLEDGKRAVRAGATALAHGIIAEPIDDEFITLMRDNHVAYIPTLTVMLNHSFEKHEHGVSKQLDLLDSVHSKLTHCLFEQVPVAPSWKEDAWKKREIGYHNIQKLHEAGVLIGAGSDAGNPYALHGVGLHNEIRALHLAGLTPAQAINAATSNAATIIHQNDNIGRLEEGYEATFSIIPQNPLTDLEHLAQITFIYKSGQRVDRAALVKANKQTVPIGNECHTPDIIAQQVDSESIDPLDKNTQWKAVSDKVMSGSSTASVNARDEGVLIEATLGKPTNFGSWAGAELHFEKPTNASQYTGIELTYKGSNTPIYFSVYHSQVKDWDHFYSIVPPSKDRNTLRIPFHTLKQFGFGASVDWSSNNLLGLSIMWRSQTIQSNAPNTIMLSSIKYY
jgi:imidazolonepropionase-like amidohydrolase